MSEEHDMRYGEEVERFLKTEAWGHTKERLSQGYAEQFRASRNPEEATKVWLRMQVLDDVQNALNVMVNRGAVAKQTKASREKQKAK